MTRGAMYGLLASSGHLAMSKVTFILPAFNGARYIEEAIESIVGQRATDWEALIVDDASTDNTASIIRNYQSDRISCLRHTPNLGLYATLRGTVARVETEYVSIIHQDDRLHPDYLDVMLPIVDRYVDVSAFWVGQDSINSAGMYLAKGQNANELEVLEAGVGSWLSGIRRGCFFTISGSLVRRDLLRRVPFRTDLPHCGDYDWMLRVLRGEAMVYVGRPLIDIRQHSEQASTRDLASGRDLREHYVVFSENMRRYRVDVKRSQLVTMCGRYSRVALRRAAGSVVQRRWAAALLQTRYAVMYLALIGRLGLSYRHSQS
jgi:glycosyltransferase involved in cell wall biosynthesis